MLSPPYLSLCNDTPTSEPYTLSLHDALPIFALVLVDPPVVPVAPGRRHLGVVLAAFELLGVEDGRHVLLDHVRRQPQRRLDRKSTRLNSSHRCISYAVFCLKKKKQQKHQSRM